ncbi:hypothetical protein BJF92_12275 [Rhizobium rhizosphaerae]|uniref:Uncharacterized protein n=1 Tax=Xaviernesmea rhizosphaerae TaxID=1672749 RepID=A0A1Q9ANA2_9HYPH|nr:hypothetical protein [Xaviernesmea rhizosphaerae]OLP56841.1 hypothetical protein BJF92_12275 [Xaviernesmea rhizosphaerae]
MAARTLSASTLWKRSLNAYLADINGDSRAAQGGVAVIPPARHIGLSNIHWLNWANALTGNRLRINRLFAVSGFRSDQYISYYRDSRLASNAGISIWNFPVVNDVSHAGAQTATGSIAGTTMTLVVNTVAGTFNPGGILSGSGVTPGTKIVSQLTGTPGKEGTYQVDTAQTVASTTITSTGYTDTITGVYVDVSNVVQVAYANLVAEWQLDLDSGKKVVLVAETGSTALNAAQVNAVLDFNLRQKAWAEAKSVHLFDFGPVVWAATQSGTLLRFKSGVLQPSDPTHFSSLGAFLQANAGPVDWIKANFVYRDKGVATAADSRPNNPRQIITNPFFLTLSGGITGANVTVSSGTVPANTKISAPAPSGPCSVAITSAAYDAADANSGNKVRFALTAGASAVVARIEFDSPPTTYWQIQDLLEAGVGVDVEANSGGAHVYGALEISTAGGGTKNAWALFGLPSQGPGPTSAYHIDLKTEIEGTLPGSTATAYAALVVYVAIPANGTAAVSLSRPWGYRRYDMPAF